MAKKEEKTFMLLITVQLSLESVSWLNKSNVKVAAIA